MTYEGINVCVWCRYAEDQHVHGKCIFQSTKYERMSDAQIRAFLDNIHRNYDHMEYETYRKLFPQNEEDYYDGPA